MRILFLFVSLFLMTPFAALSNENHCPQRAASVPELGHRFYRADIKLSRNEPFNTLGYRNIIHPARYLRVHFKIEGPLTEGWRLVIRDADFRPLEIIGPQHFGSGASDHGVWTRRHTQSKLLFDLSFSSRDTDVIISVDRFIAMPEKAAVSYYSVQDTAAPKWRDLHTQDILEAIRRTGDSVGFLTASRGRKDWCCTGVLIADSPNLLFATNFHCGAPNALPLADDAIWTDDICASTIIDFSWDDDGSSNEFVCEKVVHRDAARDLAVLRVRPISGDQPPPALTIVSKPTLVDKESELFTIHHPECRPKKITANCHVISGKIDGWRGTESGESDFSHDCDIEGGSSGAPVFNRVGHLIGFHHLGFDWDNQKKTMHQRE